MRVQDLPGRAVEHAVHMHRYISLATDPDLLAVETLNRFAEFSTIRYVVSVVVGEVPGEYHVVDRRHLAGNPVTLTDVRESWDRIDLPPAVTGGIIEELVADATAKFVHHIDIADDPVLGDTVADCGSCVVIPIYEDGRVREWAVCFLGGAEEATPEMLLATMQMANHIGATRRYLEALRVSRILTDELSRQFDEIGRVQRSLLPREVPEIPGLGVATSYRTSKQAGGDYYGFYEFVPGRWGIVIADVSGHGAAAATIMAMLQSIISSFALLGAGGPIEMVRHLNTQLCASLVGGMFVTGFFMTHDADTGRVFYSRCGHNPPRVLRAATGAIETFDSGAGLPLGIDEGLELGEAFDRLDPGDILVLYTDGITEAFDNAGVMFGTDRLDEAIRAADPVPESVVATIQQRIDAFVGGDERVDDQTLVVLRREPAA